MHRKNTITDAREFAQRIWITDECKSLAKQYPKLADFWDQCNRSDCMLALLEAAGYQNADKIWEVFGIVREHERRLSGDDDLERGRATFLRFIEDTPKQLETGKGGAENVRRAKWANAHAWTFYYAREAVQSARTRAGYATIDASLEARKSKEEIHTAWDAAAREAFVKAMKQQSDLLRDILGNPFHRMSIDDFCLRVVVDNLRPELYSMKRIPKEIVAILIAAGRREEIDVTNVPEELIEIRDFDYINRLGWDTWDEVTKIIATNDLVALMKALAVAEGAFKEWSAGSVSAFIRGNFFAELELRRYPDIRELRDWIIERVSKWETAT